MNKTLYTLLPLLLILTCQYNLQAQCPNDNTQYGTTAAPTSLGVLTFIESCHYGGEYKLVTNLVANSTYSFETCGDTDFDTQISIYDAVTGSLLAYNDDFCGLQSKATFTSNGNNVRVLIDKYYCTSQSTCMTLNATLEGVAAANPCNSISTINCNSNSSYSIASGAGTWTNGPYGTPGKEIIYQFTPTISGIHTISVTNNNYYVDLFYKSTSCSSSGWTYVDDIYTSANNDLTLTAGVTYLIMLDKENTSASNGIININCPAPCAAPSGLIATATSSSSASLSWTNSPSATTYTVEYGPTGFTQGTGISISNASSPTTISGLTASTNYEFYVRSNCGSQASAWAGPVGFTTLCTITSAPLTESFSGGALPSCWSQSAVSGSGWEFPGTPDWGVASATDHTTGSSTDFACIDFSSQDEATILQLPDVDISTLTSPYLEFYMLTNNTNSTTLNNLFVEYWDGSTWQGIANLSENTGNWAVFRYDISANTFSTNTVRIRFRAESSGLIDDYYHDILLDDISIINDPCIALRNNSPEGSNSYLCQGETGTINLTAISSGTLNWYDAATGGNLIQSGTSLSSTPSSSTNYWVEEADNNACKSQRLEVSFEVTPYKQLPVTSDNATCAGGQTTLSASTATSGNILHWYDAPTGGNIVHTGTSYNCTVNTNKTFWVENFGGTSIGLAAQSSNYSGMTRGYYFTAPCDFTISGLRVPTDASTDNQSVEIVRYNAGFAPVSLPGDNNFTSLLRATNVAGSSIIPCNLNISKGDIIGILGCRGSNSVNSYANSSAAIYNIYGNAITLTRLGMQSNLSNTSANNLFTETASSNISRVELYYGDCSSNRSAVNARISEPAYATAGSSTISDASCTVNENGVDWTYYYNSATPENLLFAIAHDPDGLGNNSFTATVDISVRSDASNPNNSTTGIHVAEDVANQEAYFVMGRHWNVSTTGNLVDPVKIRFYYQPSEYLAIESAATTWLNNYNYAPNEIGKSDAIWFKTNGSVYDPSLVISPNTLIGTIDQSNNAQASLSAANGTNYVEIDNITSFSGGSVAINVSRAAFLDVTLSSFTVQKHNDKQALIQWSTEREENMLAFNIQRSTDGIHFEEIGQVAPSGGLNQVANYAFIDQNPVAGTNYYRLAMQEISGHIDYSPTRVLEFVGDYDNIRAIPNPFEQSFNIEIDALTDTQAEIELYNSLGQLVKQQKLQLNKGSNLFPISFNYTLPSGAYWLHYNNGNSTKRLKIIKQ